LPSEIAWRTDKVGYEPPQKSWLDSKVMTDKMHHAKELLIKNRIITENSKEYPQKQWNFLVASMYL
jgi:asparagine synthase (glutamine-hydrolysing)